MIFNAYGTKYEFGFFYLLFGKFRLFEIKRIKMKKKQQKDKKINLGFIKYLRCKLDIGYTIATANLTPKYAIASSVLCSFFECMDEAAKAKITQYIYYTNWGYKFNIKLSINLFSIALSLIEYKVRTKKKLFT